MSTPDQTTPTTPGTPPAAPAAPAAPTTTAAVTYADWPKPADTRPQPWDLDAQGVPRADRELPDGAPDTVSPLKVSHSYPVLSGGSQGSFVTELGRRLAQLGFANSVSQGRNPFGVLDDTIQSAVQAFREAFNVQEDPTPYGGQTEQARARAAAHVGPWTWEALVRATERLAA